MAAIDSRSAFAISFEEFQSFLVNQLLNHVHEYPFFLLHPITLAEPISILIASAVRSPIVKLYVLRTYAVIALVHSISSQRGQIHLLQFHQVK